MAEDVVAYLQSKGLHLKRATGSNVHTACFFCDEDPSKRGRLYVNVDPDADPPALFECKLCGKTGAMGSIRKHFGDPNTRESEDYTIRYTALQAAAKFYHQQLENHPEVMEWLTEARGLTPETIRKHKIGYASGDLALHLLSLKIKLEEIKGTGLVVERNGELVDFLKNEVTVPYHQSGSIIQIRGKEIGGKYRTPPGQKAMLYNSDSLIDATEALLCEGEFDALVAEQLGFNAVGVPGASAWQEKWDQKFATVRRIYGLFDNDQSGRLGLEKVAGHLGHRFRSNTVPPFIGPEDKNDLSAWVVEQGATKEDVDALLRKSDGGLIVSVRDSFEAWQELDNIEGLQFGFPLLDQLLKPGLLPAQVCGILAKSGTGKTLMLINLFERMSQLKPGLKILFISLEQTRSEWAERAARITGFYNILRSPTFAASATGEGRSEYLQLVRQLTVNRWDNDLAIVDKNRLSEEELIGCIDDFTETMGSPPDVVAVDYLGYWASSFPGKDRYQKVSDAIMSLKAVAKEKRLSIIVPHQVNRNAEFGKEFDDDAARDSGVIFETVDFMFSIWNPDTSKGILPGDRKGVLHLKVGKSRHGNAGAVELMQLAPLSLALIPTGAGPGASTIDEQRLVNYAEMEIEWNNLMRGAKGDKRYFVDWIEAQYRHSQQELKRAEVF